MEQAIHCRFDTSVMVASLGLISNISSSQPCHQITTGENSRTKPCRPAMLSALTDNTTELMLPDGLCVGFVSLIPAACWCCYFGPCECLKNAFDSCAVAGKDRRVRHSDIWKLRGDTCLPLSVTVVSQVINCIRTWRISKGHSFKKSLEIVREMQPKNGIIICVLG